MNTISKVEEIRQAVYDHCDESGLSFNEFVDIYGPQIQTPEAFDMLFELPFDSISELTQGQRIEILINILTT